MNRSSLDQQGSVMIIVLILMMVSVSLALYTIAVSRDIVRTSQQLMDKLQAKIESGSTLEQLKYLGATNRFSPWNLENLSGNRNFPLQLNLRGTPILVGNSELRLMDSAGRLGLWPPNNEILKRVLLLGGVKVADANVAADSLLDWIDEDDLKHLNGAEKYFYRSENSLGFEPRNNRFIQSVEELELIRGFRGKAYDLVREELLDTAPGILNINTADALVLAAALDVDLESAQRLVQVREKKGIVTYVDLVGLTGKGLTFMDEYITTIPSMTLDVDIRTRFNEAGDSVRALVRFKSERDRPFTVEKYQE